MSSRNDSSERNRKKLLEAVRQAAQASSTLAIFFHTAFAERADLSAVETKTLLILSGGSLTAGEIAHRTGLTTASVTGLIDRLEKRGFVQRVRDKVDRRRVIVELDNARFDELTQIFSSVREEFDDFLDAYSDDQLKTIADYLTRSYQRSREVIAMLNEERTKPEAESEDS